MTQSDQSDQPPADPSDGAEPDAEAAALRDTLEADILNKAIAKVQAQRQVEETHTLRIPTEEAGQSDEASHPSVRIRRTSSTALPLSVRVAGVVAWCLLGAGVLFSAVCWVQPHAVGIPMGIHHWVAAGALLCGIAGWSAMGTLASIYRRTGRPLS